MRTQYLYMFLQLGVYLTCTIFYCQVFVIYRTDNIHKFKLSKFRYFYLKMHLFARYEFQQQWFWNNWNNIFPIINIYYYKYQRNVRVRYKTPSLSLFFFFKHSSQSRRNFSNIFPLQNCSFHFSVAICCSACTMETTAEHGNALLSAYF